MESDLDKIVSGLNRKIALHGYELIEGQSNNLTSEERALVNTYTPAKSLIIYGTLAPGKPNHHVVEHIRGVWQEGIVRGKLEARGWGSALGFNGFRPTAVAEQQHEIKAFILRSDALKENWKMLDDFEGEEYRRQLASYELVTGQIGVGYIYAIKE